MRTANATIKHLPRTAGQIGFARPVGFGASRLQSATSSQLNGMQPWVCTYEDRKGSPGPGDV